MRKLSDIYGYGTPSNRFVRPQSQRTENYGDPIEQEEALAPLAPAPARLGRKGLDHPGHRHRVAVAAAVDKILRQLAFHCAGDLAKVALVAFEGGRLLQPDALPVHAPCARLVRGERAAAAARGRTLRRGGEPAVGEALGEDELALPTGEVHRGHEGPRGPDPDDGALHRNEVAQLLCLQVTHRRVCLGEVEEPHEHPAGLRPVPRRLVAGFLARRLTTHMRDTYTSLWQLGLLCLC